MPARTYMYGNAVDGSYAQAAFSARRPGLRGTRHKTELHYSSTTTNFSTINASFVATYGAYSSAPSIAVSPHVRGGNKLSGSFSNLPNEMGSLNRGHASHIHNPRHSSHMQYPNPDSESDEESDSSYASGGDVVIIERHPGKQRPRLYGASIREKTKGSHQASSSPAQQSVPDERQHSYNTEVREPSWVADRSQQSVRREDALSSGDELVDCDSFQPQFKHSGSAQHHSLPRHQGRHSRSQRTQSARNPPIVHEMQGETFRPFPQQSRKFQQRSNVSEDRDKLYQSIFTDDAPSIDRSMVGDDPIPDMLPSDEQRRRSHYASTHGSGRTRSTHGPAVCKPKSVGPAFSLLSPSEAKSLFQTYDDRWKVLLPSDPDIPFPATGLQASALTRHDAILSPYTSAPPSTWSKETIMQANTQVFFLRMVGLTPQYKSAIPSGRIECGFDKRQASDAQVQDLINLLRKEKIRWHSDRIGRRNSGRSGANETLQQDERVRAVFHAVCELMEFAQ